MAKEESKLRNSKHFLPSSRRFPPAVELQESEKQEGEGKLP
jgi:hypothetical protein